MDFPRVLSTGFRLIRQKRDAGSVIKLHRMMVRGERVDSTKMSGTTEMIFPPHVL